MITILTPTYNRASLLPKLYESLLNQTAPIREWLIIDDGSKDDTESLVRSWHTDKFPIIYIKKENGGKHTALNVGFKEAKGKYIFIVDSDDYLLEHSIELVLQWINEIEHEGVKFAGVAGERIYPSGQIVGKFPEQKKYIDATNLETHKYKIQGDKAEIFKKEVVQKYSFPVFEGEKYIQESVVWSAIARDGYKMRWHRDPIYVCNYLEGGLTRSNNLPLTNFKGYTYAEKMNFKLRKFPENYLAVARFIEVGKELNKSNHDIKKLMEINNISLGIAYVFLCIKKVIKKMRMR